MVTTQRRPMWPLLCIGFCTFILSLTVPQAWRKLDSAKVAHDRTSASPLLNVSADNRNLLPSGYISIPTDDSVPAEIPALFVAALYPRISPRALHVAELPVARKTPTISEVQHLTAALFEPPSGLKQTARKAIDASKLRSPAAALGKVIGQIAERSTSALESVLDSSAGLDSPSDDSVCSAGVI